MLEFLSPSPSGCRSICPSSFPLHASVSTSASVFCPPVFPLAHSLALCRTRNAIYRAEFIERVRAFTHANVRKIAEIASRLDSWLRDCEDDFTLRDSTFNWNFFLKDYAVRQYWWDVFNAFVANVALEPSVHARIDIYVNRVLIILVTFSKLDKFINCIDAYRVICTHEKYMILYYFFFCIYITSIMIK